MSVLMLGAVAQVFIGMLMAILIADGHLRWTMALASPLVLLAIGGHLWSIPVWGPLGAAWTTSGTMLVGASTGYIAARFLGSVQLRFGSLARALLFGALGFGVSMIGPTGSPHGSWSVFRASECHSLRSMGGGKGLSRVNASSTRGVR